MTRLEQWLGRQPELMMFDLDGTLVDSVPDIAVAVDRMRAELGLAAHGEKKVRVWVGRGAEMLLRKALSDQEPYPVEYFQEAQRRFGQAYADAVHVHTRLFDGVEEALEVFSHWCPLVCITNKPMRFTAPLLQSLGLSSRFELILAGDSLAQKKPHPLPVIHTLAHFKVAPDAAVMVGDSRNDVESARAAGVRSVALSWGYNHGEALSECGPDWIVDSFRELL